MKSNLAHNCGAYIYKYTYKMYLFIYIERYYNIKSLVNYIIHIELQLSLLVFYSFLSDQQQLEYSLNIQEKKNIRYILNFKLFDLKIPIRIVQINTNEIKNYYSVPSTLLLPNKYLNLN